MPGCLGVLRGNCEWRHPRRGTLQHEVIEGQDALAFIDGKVVFKVNCSKDAGTLSDSVPLALCVSLEVAEGVPLPSTKRSGIAFRSELGCSRDHLGRVGRLQQILRVRQRLDRRNLRWRFAQGIMQFSRCRISAQPSSDEKTGQGSG